MSLTTTMTRKRDMCSRDRPIRPARPPSGGRGAHAGTTVADYTRPQMMNRQKIDYDTGTPPAATTTGSGHEMTPAELFALQPGLARLMPEIGVRFWKCYYAARAANWALASWQMREMKKLFRLARVTRPRYVEDIDAYLSDVLGPLTAALDQQDFDSFDRNYRAAITSANDYHDKWKKGYIVWKLPDEPPPDLDLTPHPSAG